MVLVDCTLTFVPESWLGSNYDSLSANKGQPTFLVGTRTSQISFPAKSSAERPEEELGSSLSKHVTRNIYEDAWAAALEEFRCSLFVTGM